VSIETWLMLISIQLSIISSLLVMLVI